MRTASYLWVLRRLALPLVGASVGILSCLGQGTITFGNNLPGSLDAPIYFAELSHPEGDWANPKTGNTADGFPPGDQVYSGSPLGSYYVGFWAQAGIWEDGHLLFPSPVVLRLDSGYFPTTAVDFPFLPSSGIASVQVRVWKTELGPDPGAWDENIAVIEAGASAIFTAEIGGTATGFRSFSLGWLDYEKLIPPIPEPRFINLLALAGAVALAMRRSAVQRGQGPHSGRNANPRPE